jgi:beta-lactamase class D
MGMLNGQAPRGRVLPFFVGLVLALQGGQPAWTAPVVDPLAWEEEPAWREEPAVSALFQRAGVAGTFVLLDESTGLLHGSNVRRAAQRFTPASTFKIPNTLIGLSFGAVKSVDERIPYTGDPNPWIREWLEPMGLRGAIRVSNVPIYQELARRIGHAPMKEALHRLNYGNGQIGTDVTTF